VASRVRVSTRRLLWGDCRFHVIVADERRGREMRWWKSWCKVGLVVYDKYLILPPENLLLCFSVERFKSSETRVGQMDQISLFTPS
jgi:hypothetical protein